MAKLTLPSNTDAEIFVHGNISKIEAKWPQSLHAVDIGGNFKPSADGPLASNADLQGGEGLIPNYLSAGTYTPTAKEFA